MSLQDHVPELSLCRDWKEVGGRQDTELEWYHAGYGEFKLRFKVPPPAISYTNGVEGFAAPLASELMEWIKEKYTNHNITMMELMAKIMNYLSGYIVESLPNILMLLAIALKKEEK